MSKKNIIINETQTRELNESIQLLSNDRNVFGKDEDGRFSVNTSFICPYTIVYFDSNESFEDAIKSMIKYCLTCMNHSESILTDSLIKIGFPDAQKFKNYILSK